MNASGSAENITGDDLTAMTALLNVSRKAGKDVKKYDYVVAFKATNNNYTIDKVNGAAVMQQRASAQ